MVHIKSFSARYTDEGTIYDQLGKLFPMASSGVAVSYERGRFFCTTPRELTKEEVNTIKRAIKENHYEQDEI